MIDQPLATVFGTVGVVYGLIVPLVLVVLFAFFFIASLLSPNARPVKIAQAVYCYLMMGFGILLMTIAALPTVTSVLAGTSYASATYVGLLVVFAAGGCIFLWHDNWAQALDANSRLVPSLIFLYTIKTIGSLTALLSALSIILTMVLGGAEAGWWIMPVTLLLYGFVLYMSTQGEKGPTPPIFCNMCVKMPKVPKMPKVKPRLPKMKKLSMSVAKKPSKTKKKGKKKRRKKRK